MAQGIDLRTLTNDPERARAMLRDAEKGLQRGVDLSALKAKREHEHKWVLVAQFEMPEKTIAAMAERRLQLANLIAAGEDIPEDGVGAVPMPMGENNIIWSEGPGCVKCGAHWEHPELGHGFKCSVSDEDWRARQEVQANAQASMSFENLRLLVERQQRTMNMKATESKNA